MPPETSEYMFAAVLLLLLSVSAGLYMWHREHKSCPIGTGKASGIAGIVGAIALICPACTVIPITLLGASVSLSVLGPFMPLLRIVALLIATVTLVLLWPRKHHHA
jgi:Co/Zn/Cd efflux system component